MRIESELQFDSTPERVFRALTQETLEWFPHTYGEGRTKAVIVEPHVGGRHCEDWGEGRGHLYGHVTAYDPPHGFSTRGRLKPGTILDSEYTLEANGDGVLLRMSKTAVGPMTEEEAESIHTLGDIARFSEPLRRIVEAG